MRRIFVMVVLAVMGFGWAPEFSVVEGAEGRRPNVLFAIADDWSFGHAGVFGAKWVKTPSFDRVANEGVLFNNCFTSNPKCCPCRATILTGRNSWQLDELVNHMAIFPKKFEVFPDLFEAAGYHMGMTGKGWGPGDYKGQGWTHNPAGHEYQAIKNKTPYKGMRSTDYAANFEVFLEEREEGQPFCFWYGASEPHRGYEDGAGVRSGKDINDVKLPKYYPNNATIKSDFLDYALEVEWFDTHLGRIMKKLEEIGELDNTIIMVSSDHGMPFPRVKGQIYEHGFHIPLAVRWPRGFEGGRVVDDFINTRDFAPTFCEAAGVAPAKGFTGKSFLDVLKSGKNGRVDEGRDVMLVAKERHDIGRPNDWGYPVRAIRTEEWLYIRNYHPERWPAGNPETGYRNVDGSPTKNYLVGKFDEYYKMSFGKRPAEELFRVSSDPDNVVNLALDPKYAGKLVELRERMEGMLKEQGDKRFNGDVEFFDEIQYMGRKTHGWDAWVGNKE